MRNVYSVVIECLELTDIPPLCIAAGQRKFREVDEEESYFDCDDDEDGMQGVDDSRTMNETTDVENDLHRTPRMFSLTEQTSSTDSREEEIGHGDERQQTTEAENGTGTVDAPI